MKKFNLYFLILTGIVSFHSCNNEKQNTEMSNIDTELNPFQELFDQFKLGQLDFKSDTILLQDFEIIDSLKAEDVQLLIKNLNINPEEQYSYFPDYFKIDSLKKLNEYSAFVNGLDIGQTQDVNAKPIKKFIIENKTLLLWCLNYESYPACPYFSGNEFYLSVFEKNEHTKTIKIGENSYAGDPPAAYSCVQNFEILKNGKIKTNTEIISQDDEETVKKTNNSETFTL